MARLDPAQTAHLEIGGEETKEHVVAADVLIRVLEGLQQAAVCIVAAQLQLPVQQKFRPPESVRRQCRLQCAPLRAGSVALDVAFPPEVEPMFSDDSSEPLMGRLMQFAAAVAGGDVRAVNRLVPDSKLRERALRASLGFLPQPGQRWALRVSSGRLRDIELGHPARLNIERWFVESGQGDSVITGTLARIDFLKNEVYIKYPPTGKRLRLSYEVDAEDSLFRNRRGWVQAHGRFEFDDAGLAKSVLSVMRIDPVDLSPLTVSEFDCAGRRYKVDPPLEVTPALDEDSSQFLTVEDKSLDLYAYAQTREKLETEVLSHLCLLWTEYAQEDPDKLSPKAQELRLALRRRIKDATDAPETA